MKCFFFEAGCPALLSLAMLGCGQVGIQLAFQGCDPRQGGVVGLMSVSNHSGQDLTYLRPCFNGTRIVDSTGSVIEDIPPYTICGALDMVFPKITIPNGQTYTEPVFLWNETLPSGPAPPGTYGANVYLPSGPSSETVWFALPGCTPTKGTTLAPSDASG